MILDLLQPVVISAVLAATCGSTAAQEPTAAASEVISELPEPVRLNPTVHLP